MHKKFDHSEIEKKWQNKWKETGIYNVGKRNPAKDKKYVLVEWPYPSGDLHIGHWFAFAVVDIYVRHLRMQGKQVLFPIGFDAFGLPAENAAIKRNISPKEWTMSNIERMTKQLESMGNAFSWDKSVSSTDPEYYKWTQWMFTEFFKNDIAYRGTGTVNWCPSCNTVLANEQVKSDGTCERCDTKTTKREMPEWKLRITKYADRLIDDLDALAWPTFIKDSQKNWIGRSRGAKIPFVLSSGETIDVFTTRPDTLFGATFLVVAPELPLLAALPLTNREVVMEYVAAAKQKDEIERTNATKEKTGIKLEGVTATNPATGEQVPIFVADYVLAGYGTGAIMAVPAHDERDFAFAKKYNLPVREVIRPHVIDHINTPRADKPTITRNNVHAIVYNPKDNTYLTLKNDTHGWNTIVIGGIDEGESPEEAARREVREETGYTNLTFKRILGSPVQASYFAKHKDENRTSVTTAVLFELADDTRIDLHEDEDGTNEIVWRPAHEFRQGVMINSELPIWNERLASEDDVAWTGSGVLIQSGIYDGMDSEIAKEKITEAVHGHTTSTYRIRDWSIGRQRYWGVPIPIVYDPEGNAHPIPAEHLPWHLPTDVDFKPTGEAPLAKSKELRERVERIFGKGWLPEVETMDTFVDSSWYYLRYLDGGNDTTLSSLEVQKEWMPIDVYFGGSEHTTMHVLYSRFWQKALYDLGLVLHSEPYTVRINRGLVLGPDGNKMSKSKGNVINPDEQVERVGADTVKIYLAFMGNYGEPSNYPWDMGGIAGIRRFLERVNGLSTHITQEVDEKQETLRALHKTLQKVNSDITALKFNTAISALMIFVNHAEKHGLTKQTYEIFLRAIAPFAPHLSEELWYEAGHTESIHSTDFPIHDPELAEDDMVTIGVQISGKRRADIEIQKDASEADAIALARSNEKLAPYLSSGIRKVVYVPGRILNIIPE